MSLLYSVQYCLYVRELTSHFKDTFTAFSVTGRTSTPYLHPELPAVEGERVCQGIVSFRLDARE